MSESMALVGLDVAADRLRARQTDVVRFCMERNHTNVFLVEGIHLTETDWGKEVETLTDLRLMHRLGDYSLPSGAWRGRRFVAFTLSAEPRSEYGGSCKSQSAREPCCVLSSEICPHA
jgi:hypothetical protein